MAHTISMVHDADPKEAIWNDVGRHVGAMRVMGARILVAVYVPPEKTKSGLYLTSKSRDEANYQGKVGLVLKLGPLAFQEDPTHRFGPDTPKPGDWVVFSVGETFAFELGERRCRCVEDVDVQMIVQQPDSIW
jgi:co-chaperonin GroES (HSP10)